jgi:hypothetical protein
MALPRYHLAEAVFKTPQPIRLPQVLQISEENR